MRGYITIPASVSCAVCKECGARPIIALAEAGEYIVKCPNSDSHYHTEPGLIDMDDWNIHNIPAAPEEVSISTSNSNSHFFFLNGDITSLNDNE
jgi:hypothetical protein